MVKRIAILFSGSGSNLEAILQKVHNKIFNGIKIEAVLTLSNKAGVGGIAKAEKFGLKSVVLDHTKFNSREEFDTALVSEIKKYNIDLAKSYAYGDTNGDFSMLSLVGNPRAINPSKELITKIKNDKNLSSKTQIIIERKDVIYKLNSNVELIEF